MKLRWSAHAGSSEKQVGDALGVYEFQGDALDQTYLDTWAQRMDLVVALAVIRKRARAG